MTSSHHGPYVLGYTRATMAGKQRVAKPRGGANPKKPVSVRIVRLKLARVKSELLVIAGQHTAVNTFPGLVHTARHTMRVCNTRSQ
jgi:hypothetical protein